MCGRWRRATSESDERSGRRAAGSRHALAAPVVANRLAPIRWTCSCEIELIGGDLGELAKIGVASAWPTSTSMSPSASTRLCGQRISLSLGR